jgi:branched-chain amino acid transport system ATP-binding protein
MSATRHTPGSDAAPATPALEITDLSVAYGGIKAVKGISFRIDPGQIVALIGANGAGKTSTLKAIVGLVPARSGKIRLFGRDVLGTPTHHIVAQGVTLVPEGRAIFAGMSVRENLELGSILKRDKAGMDARMQRVLALFPRLGERFDQAGGTLSGGEQQMLAIGRALMGDPRVLLLDEPSLGLAPKLVRQIFDGISEIARTGLTILLVEQNTRLALETAHQAHVLVTGELSLSGESKALKEDPRVRAAYLGEDVKV